MDRSERVAELEKLGYVASARDWALGETIAVAHASLGTTHDGITVYETVIHLRHEDDAWLITDSRCRGAEPHARLDEWGEVLSYLRRRLIDREPVP